MESRNMVTINYAPKEIILRLDVSNLTLIDAEKLYNEVCKTKYHMGNFPYVLGSLTLTRRGLR